ncbi:MAG: YbaB/EbfC family nucleoid-associated protein [Negativicutes bacterium]|nr:YbaB/EbfC family nucleoid-associated protein [Negativicutes bacterium]
MFGNMGNMGQLMKKMQKLQADMAKMQEELKGRIVETSAGGGAVKVTVTGEKQIKSIKIDPAAVDPADIEMLEDLVTAAVNDALKKVDDMMAQEMGKLTGGMNLPPGLF